MTDNDIEYREAPKGCRYAVLGLLFIALYALAAVLIIRAAASSPTESNWVCMTTTDGADEVCWRAK